MKLISLVIELIDLAANGNEAPRLALLGLVFERGRFGPEYTASLVDEAIRCRAYSAVASDAVPDDPSIYDPAFVAFSAACDQEQGAFKCLWDAIVDHSDVADPRAYPIDLS